MRTFEPERVFCQTDGKATLFGAIIGVANFDWDRQDLLDEQDFMFGGFLDLMGVGLFYCAFAGEFFVRIILFVSIV